MAVDCPSCGTPNPDVACFCRNCGLKLETAGSAPPVPGETPHPNPLPPPEGFWAIDWAANLHFRWAAAGGGAPLLGTETIALTVFNGGYGLAEVALGIRGEDKAGQPLFGIQREIEHWPRGELVRIEIPSYELPGPVQSLYVELVKAEFAKQD